MVVILIPRKCFFTLVDIALTLILPFAIMVIVSRVNAQGFNNKYTFKIVLSQHIQTDIVAD